MKILTRGNLIDMDPMDSEANAASELDRMFPIPGVGFGSGLGEIGFQKGIGEALAALKMRLNNEEDQRKARTAEDVARMNSGTSFASALLNAIINNLTRRDQQDIEREKIASGERTAEALRKSNLDTEIYRQKAETGRTSMKGETDIQKAQISADAQNNLNKLLAKAGTNADSYNVFYQKAKDALGKKATPDQINQMAGKMRREFLGADAGGGDSGFRAEAKSIYGNVDPNDPRVQKMRAAGGAISLPDSVPAQEAPKNWRWSNQDSYEDPRNRLDMSKVDSERSVGRIEGANPMSRNVSPETQAILQRVRDEVMQNPPVGYQQIKGTPGFTGKRQDQFIPIRAEQSTDSGSKLNMGPFDAYATGDFTDAPNANRLSELFQQPRSSMPQEQEDVLREPNATERLHGIMGKIYGNPDTQSFADILPMLAAGGAGIIGKILKGLGGAARPGQLLLNRGSWASQEPLALPSGARPQLPSGMGRPLPSGGPQGQITPNPFEMGPARGYGELPGGGGGADIAPYSEPSSIPLSQRMDISGLRPMGAAPQTGTPQLPPGLSSQGELPSEVWTLLKRLYDLRTTGVY